MSMSIVVNGCFDCFHEGHQHILHNAWRLAQQGIVYILLNDDASIKRLKCRNPILNENQRQDAITQFWNSKHNKYDYTKFHIFRFSTEEELYRLIEDLDPDIILKGNDRPDVRDIVGSDKYPICIIPRLKDKDGKDISTTRKINEQKANTK